LPFFQYRKPRRSCPGTPPRSMIKLQVGRGTLANDRSKRGSSCSAHPSRINPVKVRILIKLSQNSTSPKALIPKVLIAMTKTIRMVTQAAELISEFQNLDDIATNPRDEPAFVRVVTQRSIDVPDDKRPSDDLVGRDDQVLAQVNKGSGETEGGVDKSSGMTAEDPQRTRQCRYSKFSAYTRYTRSARPGFMKLTRNLSSKGTW
jgi:hypothetical protein